jgi:hypothetical protein
VRKPAEVRDRRNLAVVGHWQALLAITEDDVIALHPAACEKRGAKTALVPREVRSAPQADLSGWMWIS